MSRQIRRTAGIHFSTFKDKGENEADMDDSDAEDAENGSLWTPLPSFFADMRRAEAKAGI